jgi:DNA-binding HxlR family transcriptional regulator
MVPHAVPVETSPDIRASAPGARARSPVSITADLLRGRFTAPILWNLFWGRKGFYQILRELDGIGRSGLARELEELERVGIVERRPRRFGGPRVQYSLSPLGHTLRPVVGAMYQWGLMAMNLPVAQALAAKPRRVPQEEHSRAEAAPAEPAGRPAPPAT